jgi:hypothetical protein
MDDLIGALFLVLFAVLAGLRKLYEQRQLKQEQERRVLTGEALPEKTPQILHAEREPTAQELEEQRRRILEQQRGQAAPPPMRRQEPLAPPREAAEETVRQAREQYERARQKAHRRVARPQPGQAEAEQRLEAEQRRARVTEPRRAAPRPVRASRGRSHPIFQGLGDVRRGMVMREILGPPKGLE